MSTRREWELVCSYVDQQHAPKTKLIYRSSINKFDRWCRERDLEPLPASPETIAMFLATEADSGLKPSTIARHTAAIRYHHIGAGYPDPTRDPIVRSTKKGIRRALGAAPVRKQPATLNDLRRMIEATDGTLRGLRDRAILLLGFAGAFRRSEIARLEVKDVEMLDEGLRITVRKSKTDQDGQGQVVHIPRGNGLCPVQAVLDWLAASGVDAGALFRRVNKSGRVLEAGMTPHAIGNLVKDYAKRSGLDPAAFAGHSLRSGFLTAAARNGASVWLLMQVSRHKSVESVRDYVRGAEGFRENAGVGLM